MILVDASVWVATFRVQHDLDLEDVLDFDEIVTCLPWCRKCCRVFGMKARSEAPAKRCSLFRSSSRPSATMSLQPQSISTGAHGAVA